MIVNILAIVARTSIYLEVLFNFLVVYNLFVLLLPAEAGFYIFIMQHSSLY